MTGRRQEGWVHAVVLALLVTAALLYVSIPLLLTSLCEPSEPPPPLAVVLRDGGQNRYCLWQITPAFKLAPLPEHPAIPPVSVQRCAPGAADLQREADIFNANRLPSAGHPAAVECRPVSFVDLIPDAHAYWQRLWKPAP